jgi:hypothetical protein
LIDLEFEVIDLPADLNHNPFSFGCNDASLYIRQSRDADAAGASEKSKTLTSIPLVSPKATKQHFRAAYWTAD